MPKGGPNRGQGRHPKPPEQHRKRVMVSLPPELVARLQAHGKKSKLIQKLLIEYFERTEQ